MIRRRKPVEAKVSSDRWLVSYADFITLLFAFFVVMYSVSQVNETEYRELSETLSATFERRSQATPGERVGQPGDGKLVAIAELARTIEAALAELIEAKQVTVRSTEEWVEISVNANLLFDTASASPSAEARQIFAEVSTLLAPYDNGIKVSGHTDNLPIHNKQFANNWELSAARATSVVELLRQNGVAPQRLAAIGYGEFQPLADNSTEAGRAQNRRVVLQVARRQAEPVAVALEDLPSLLESASGEQGRGEQGGSAQGTGEQLFEPASEPVLPPATGENERPQQSSEQRDDEQPLQPDDETPRSVGGQPSAANTERAAQPATELDPREVEQTRNPEGASVQPIVREDGSLLFTSDPDAATER